MLEDVLALSQHIHAAGWPQGCRGKGLLLAVLWDPAVEVLQLCPGACKTFGGSWLQCAVPCLVCLGSVDPGWGWCKAQEKKRLFLF